MEIQSHQGSLPRQKRSLELEWEQDHVTEW
jgi:hypothetical protein